MLGLKQTSPRLPVQEQGPCAIGEMLKGSYETAHWRCLPSAMASPPVQGSNDGECEYSFNSIYDRHTLA